ncbi:MAG TPA: glycogen-binding domain-containing protein, partial [Kiritimatiellia bacterium]
TFEAAYLRDSGDKVFMQKPDGRQAMISLAALSDADQTYIAEHREDPTKAPEVDPFADIKPRVEDPATKRVPYTFTYSDAAAQKVELAGAFNQFKREEMTSDGAGMWSITVDLKPGKHEYKFVVDGKWVYDPNNPDRLQTGKYENSVVDVKPAVVAPEESAAAVE